jgi:hypothetical protein
VRTLAALALVTAVAAAAAATAGADVGLRLTDTVVPLGGWIRGVGEGSGMPVYLVPARLAPRRHACRVNAICEPTTRRPPRPPFVLLGRLRPTADIYATQRFRFRAPHVRPGLYRVFLLCRPCGGSLIMSGDTLSGQTLRIVA